MFLKKTTFIILSHWQSCKHSTIENYASRVTQRAVFIVSITLASYVTYDRRLLQGWPLVPLQFKRERESDTET